VSENLPRWTSDEVETLRRLYPSAPRSEVIAALPRRSWGSVRDKASSLKLTRDKSKAQAEAEHKKRNESRRASDRLVLEDIIDYTRQFGFGPTRAEIAERTGRASSTVGNVVNRLVARGYLIRSSGKNRAVGLSPALRRKLDQQERNRVRALKDAA
jgi:hypothetical protein